MNVLPHVTSNDDNALTGDDGAYIGVKKPSTARGDGHDYEHLYEQPVSSGPRPSSNDDIGKRNVPKPPADRPTNYVDLLDDERRSGNIPKPPANRPTTYLEMLGDDAQC